MSRGQSVAAAPTVRPACAKGWHNRHGRFYSPEALAERILTPSADAFRFTIFRVRNGQTIDPSIYANFGLLAERT